MKYLLLLLLAAPLSAQGSRQDSLDAAVIKSRAQASKTANGVGNRRAIGDTIINRANTWLARPNLVDTVTVTDTIVRVDTVRIPVPVDSVLPLPTPPIVIPPGTDTTLLGRLLGPLPPSLAAVRALGEPFTRYADQWLSWAGQRWGTDGFAWEASDYYDRAQQFIALARLTADSNWAYRGNVIARSYRVGYLASQTPPYMFNTSSYWSMPRGLATEYAVTRDTAARNAIGYAAGWLTSGYGYDRLATHAEMESRWRARMLEIAVLAHAVGAPLTGPWVGYVHPAPGATWKEKAKNILDRILEAQSPDGAWRDAQSCYGTKPFMDVGLLDDALIFYYRLVEADPRIPSAVERSTEYVWAKTWLPAQRAFAYYEIPCSTAEGSGGREATPDLTLMFAYPYAWVAARTGSAAHRARVDSIFAGGVAGMYPQGSKQYNQAYLSSWRALTLFFPQK